MPRAVSGDFFAQRFAERRRGDGMSSVLSTECGLRAVTSSSYHAHTSGNDDRRRRSADGSTRRGLLEVDVRFAPGVTMRHHNVRGDLPIVENGARDADDAHAIARVHV